MEKGTKGSRCTSASHRKMKDNVQNRLNDLQQKFFDFQAARKEARIGDVAVLEEQMYRDLCEWKNELDAPSLASSLLGDSIGSFSDDIARLLQLSEEEDDATSGMAKQSTMKPERGPESNIEGLNLSNIWTFQDEYLLNINPQDLAFESFGQPNSSPWCSQNRVVSTSDMSTFWDCHQYILDDGFNRGPSISTNGKCEKDENSCILPSSSTPLSAIPPPSAFLGPNCALWDCTRPVEGCGLYKDYCSRFHATLALNEGLPGMNPVLRPNGIGLKDTLLFYTVSAKMEGKNVGIPQCEGAANMKSPWNASDLFDLSLLEGETVREWLFFDRPRKAFDSGNRKQRSLPDYKGRGWHESRKQVMKEYGGQKRSYYMDPQPSGSCEWHLYEYEISNSDACALYRLELKLVDGKKTPKGNSAKNLLVDLQKRMGRLTADATADESPSDTSSMKAIQEACAGDVNLPQDQKTTSSGSLVHDLVRSSFK